MSGQASVSTHLTSNDTLKYISAVMHKGNLLCNIILCKLWLVVVATAPLSITCTFHPYTLTACLKHLPCIWDCKLFRSEFTWYLYSASHIALLLVILICMLRFIHTFYFSSTNPSYVLTLLCSTYKLPILSYPLGPLLIHHEPFYYNINCLSFG